MAGIFDPDFEPPDDSPDGYQGMYAAIGRQASAQRLGATLYEIPPQQSSCPYHWHAANEEMLIVLSGIPTLRTPDGERELSEGEVVAFPIGEAGAHKLTNHGGEPCRVLIISEMNEPEVVVYPDSGKVLARQQAPGTPATGLRAIFRQADAVDYWEGEASPGQPE
jgi:uncharacterized cupin superfamily protein